MNHSFNVEIAKDHGILPAILLENIYFWTKKNQANDTHFYDGYYWTYNSAKAFAELFPYASEKTIRNALKKLVDDGILITGNYNKLKLDRTLWYALTDKGIGLFEENASEHKEKCIFPNGQMEVPKWENASSQKDTPIPYINADIKPFINSYNNVQTEFEKLWSLYPRKAGKQAAFKAYQSAVKKGTKFDDVKNGIERYCAYIRRERVPDKFVKMGSTYFNGHCWLDDFGDSPDADTSDIDAAFGG